MATPPSPLAGAPSPGGGPDPRLMATVMGALQNRTSNPGKDVSAQMANVQGADPTMILRQLEQVNQLLGVLFVRTFENLPNLANQISATMKALSRAIKEGQQASSTSEVVGKGQQQPINFSAAQDGENSAPERIAP